MRSRLARRLVRTALVLLALVVVLLAAGWFVLSLPPFGAPMSGERLARALANPQYREGRFVNLEPEAPSTTSLFDYTLRQLTGDEVREPPAPVPVLTVDKAALAGALPAHGLRAFWIGHASTYVEIDGRRLLLDPVFADRVSPLPVGPGRFHPPPIALADLPTIDAVLISHDHYDHLDMDTVRQLAQRGSRFFVPLGVGAHLERWGVPPSQIEEMAWWQARSLGPLRIVCTPSRHYSGRGLDRSTTLWSSWSVIGPQHRFFYSGDTGYAKAFAEIGARLGPFDMAFIKIGAYGPGAAWTDIHMTPEQAVQVHRDVRARRMVPVHWSTFNLAYHDWDEPIRRTVAEAARAGVELVTPRVGEMVDADRPFESTRWWEDVR
ncbi:MBL fold metallo-hydrolase [Ramlibacter sp.]|uniref:MBL fold metallo-hydrolase n=1 Tax=Ramlibacter sp. TaxID=1917967 RepID=UPI002D54834D|nr:MBL fold metallo-hydrolase [Ramlibacter sp.]HYD76909.1 MBL fold metallo-hydrolase [Ramlibacter sp.]